VVIGNTQAAANYMLSVSVLASISGSQLTWWQELTVFKVDFPTDTSSIKFRAVQWICTEVLLALAALLNFLPRTWTSGYSFYSPCSPIHLARFFKWVFWLSAMIVMLDFVMNVIWLPIGAHDTWGFRTAHEAFMTTYNGTGAPAGWNWCLSYLATAGILIGFDASGHVAEETKNASITAARGIFWSTVASGVGGLATIILFLFCAVRIRLSYICRSVPSANLTTS
jgi:amino acid transporter